MDGIMERYTQETSILSLVFKKVWIEYEKMLKSDTTSNFLTVSF